MTSLSPTDIDRKSYGTGKGQFYYPFGITADSGGNVYVADFNNNRIQKFTSTGTFIMTWGSNGSADGQLYGPCGIAKGSSTGVYVADTFNNRIQKFAP